MANWIENSYEYKNGNSLVGKQLGSALSGIIQDTYNSTLGTIKYNKESAKAQAQLEADLEKAAQDYQYDAALSQQGYNQDALLSQQGYEQDLALQQQQQMFDLYSSSTEQQRQVADMKAAGLNVGAMNGGSGSSTAAATGTTGTGAAPTANPKTGNQEGELDATNALIINSMIKTAEHHRAELIKGLYTAAKHQANTAKAMLTPIQ